MKKIFCFVFLYVLIFLVFPPIVAQFLTERQSEIVANYPFQVFFNGIIAFLIYIFSIKGWIFSEPILREKKPFFVFSSNALVCFGVLCLSSVIFEAISYFFYAGGGIQKVVFPSDFLGFINFFFGVIFASFFEEVIYRFFLPNAFKEIFGKRVLRRSFSRNAGETVKESTPLKAVSTRLKYRSRTTIISELLALIFFALAHIYLGVFGFLNALACGIVLRVCIKKTESIWIPFAVHTIYNFLSFGAFFLISTP